MSRDRDPRDRQMFALIADLGRAGRGLQQGDVFCEGVTFTQFYILDLVEQAGRLALRDLHQTLAVDKSTTTRLVEPLLTRGLIRRERCCADSRARELVLTGEGGSVLDRLWSCVSGVLGEIRRALPEGEAEQTIAAVRGFLGALRRVCAPGCCSCRDQTTGCAETDDDPRQERSRRGS